MDVSPRTHHSLRYSPFSSTGGLASLMLFPTCSLQASEFATPTLLLPSFLSTGRKFGKIKDSFFLLLCLVCLSDHRDRSISDFVNFNTKEPDGTSRKTGICFLCYTFWLQPSEILAGLPTGAVGKESNCSSLDCYGGAGLIPSPAQWVMRRLQEFLSWLSSNKPD